jgi:geranylgeranyl diphosphate synthase type II
VRVRFDAEREAIERRLDEICVEHLASVPQDIAEGVRYGLKSPGKRIRPLLLLLAYRAARGDADATLLACAPEVIHSYSLMHDDLPCMDDDDMRRGRPTVHKVYGSRTAILAGAAMIPLAARVVRESARVMRMPPRVRKSLLDILLSAGGAGGMIGGQLRDLEGERRMNGGQVRDLAARTRVVGGRPRGLSLSLSELEGIHSAKTGALIVASVRMGAVAAGASSEETAAFERYGRSIGLAFQIMDDVLDVTSTTSALGKETGRDAALGKSTFPALLGVDGARERARALIDTGLEALAACGRLTQELSQVANFMVTRTS